MPSVKFDFWHDRAAFHFLTDEEKIFKYVSIAEDAINKNGYLMSGTFSDEGPKECSGLEIQQYRSSNERKKFEVAFFRIKCIRENHSTQFDTIQNFLFYSSRKK